MNDNEKVIKMKKAAHIASVAVTVVMVFWAVFLGAVLVMGIVYNQLPLPEVVQAVMESMAKEGVVFAFVVTVLVCAVLVKGGLYMAVLVQIRRIMRDISIHETPFETIHVKRMKRIAVLIFVGSFINMMSIQIVEWIIALVVWFIAMVFDYGCQLQRESDETL